MGKQECAAAACALLRGWTLAQAAWHAYFNIDIRCFQGLFSLAKPTVFLKPMVLLITEMAISKGVSPVAWWEGRGGERRGGEGRGRICGWAVAWVAGERVLGRLVRGALKCSTLPSALPYWKLVSQIRVRVYILEPTSATSATRDEGMTPLVFLSCLLLLLGSLVAATPKCWQSPLFPLVDWPFCALLSVPGASYTFTLYWRPDGNVSSGSGNVTFAVSVDQAVDWLGLGVTESGSRQHTHTHAPHMCTRMESTHMHALGCMECTHRA